MPDSLLNGLTPARFLRQHWQKKPLLSRSALPDLDQLISRRDLFELAQNGDIESRLVTRRGNRWQIAHGPFRKSALARLPSRNWTLLVQGVDLMLPQARHLLDRFDFIPYARMDDLMVSYAPPGGGVGPHFDSYDVFLLQGAGRRHWQLSSQRDLELMDNAPLKILRQFRPSRQYTLEPGDLLYLPPRYAHNGVAMDECITLSVGFRAPSAQDLGSRFLDYLQDRLALSGRYTDPGLKIAHQPARIPSAMMRGLAQLLDQMRWSNGDVRHFIGTDLSSPKPHVVFNLPRPALSAAAFRKTARQHGLQLVAATILLYDKQRMYCNGEPLMPSGSTLTLLCRLADRRSLPPGFRGSDAAAELLYAWYRAGFLIIPPR